jgi:hypothetical protein
MATITTPITDMPTPMPTFAPVVRPLDEGSGVAGGVDEPVADGKGDVEDGCAVPDAVDVGNCVEAALRIISSEACQKIGTP